MFFHIFKYKIIGLLKVKEAVFWNLLFPILLSTLFYFAFGNLSYSQMLEKVNVAIVSSDITDSNFTKAITSSDLFTISYTTEDEAKNLLDKGKITGYISGTDSLKLTVNNTGLNQSMLKTFLDGYSQGNSSVTTLIEINPQGVTEELIGSLSKEPSYITKAPVNESNDTNVLYFYALLAMTCLMAANAGCYDVVHIQANQSKIAARQSIAPTHKMKIFLASISATVAFQCMSILLVLGYMSSILKVDFGNSMGYVVLLCLVSTLTGITLGTFIGSVVKVAENVKMAIVISATMIFSFLAGLMSVDVKYIVQTAFPPISFINPANLMTDGLLSLYYYNSHSRYFLSLGILAGMTIVFSAITYLVLRRQKYASI